MKTKQIKGTAWLKLHNPKKFYEHQSNAGKKSILKLNKWRVENPKEAKKVYQNAQEKTVEILKNKPNHYLNMGLKGTEAQSITKDEKVMRKLLPKDFVHNNRLGKTVPDFHSNKRKIVIEVDGDNHYSDPVKSNDIRKNIYWQNIGYQVFRFTYYNINNYMRLLL